MAGTVLVTRHARGRPFSSDVDDRLRLAAIGIASEAGSLSAMAVSDLCARAEISKASFYRRHKDIDDFLVRLLAGMRPPIRPDSPDGSLGEDIADHLGDIAGSDLATTRLLNSALLQSGGQESPLLRDYIENEAKPRRKSLVRRLERAVERGELDRETDIAMLFEMLTAPILKFVFSPSRLREVPRDMIDRLIRQVLRGITR